ncbi:response regulator [Actinospica robiniae]|uniref:response regulator n=1 Tax=Actinospica robiniae TaxID=304901 RepID=UPI00041F933F|nr:response regulator transcription factor [Actinospica robiniae]
MAIKVVVADDQELVRAGFGMILDAQPDIEVVAEAANGLEAVDAVARTQADIALLDVRMPELDGLEAARRICGKGGTRAIMLTTFDIDDYVYTALQAGASGFLLKDVRRDDLVHAVRVVHGGEALLAPSVTKRLIEQFARRPERAAAAAFPPDAAISQLTTRELETLKLLARGLSNAEIAAEFVVSEHTVKTHVGNVLSKLHLRDRIHAVVYAYESGLVQAGQRAEEP